MPTPEDPLEQTAAVQKFILETTDAYAPETGKKQRSEKDRLEEKFEIGSRNSGHSRSGRDSK